MAGPGIYGNLKERTEEETLRKKRTAGMTTEEMVAGMLDVVDTL